MKAVSVLQGGGEPKYALSCRSFFAKEPHIVGLLFVENDRARGGQAHCTEKKSGILSRSLSNYRYREFM